MAIFNSYVSLAEGILNYYHPIYFFKIQKLRHQGAAHKLPTLKSR